MGVLLLVVSLAMVLSAALLIPVVDGRTQDRLQAQQTMMADIWARMLTARMEAHQRLLTAIAQGMHTSLLDHPAVLDGLMQQEGSMLRLFETVYVARPNGSITLHGNTSYGLPADMDSQGRDALRRTITDGKPRVTYVQVHDSIDFLHVLLSVPMRQSDGRVAGALAALVKLPVAALMPEQEMEAQDVQYLIIRSDGQVLVHSDHLQRDRSIEDILGTRWQGWQPQPQSSVLNAQTHLWGNILATRVSLPQPQWQAIVVSDISQSMLMAQGLPLNVWLIALAAGCLIAVGAAWLLWVWWAPWSRDAALQAALQAGYVEDPASEPLALLSQPDASSQVHDVQARAAAVLEAVPSMLLLEQEDLVCMATPQMLVVLGYGLAEGESVPMQQLLVHASDVRQVRNDLVDLGGFDGVLAFRKKDGGVLPLHVVAWSPSRLPSATVWELRLPWRQHVSAPLPGDVVSWHDSLTGLPNREAFVWGLQSWATACMTVPPEAAATALPAQGCLLFVDVDNLGMINEITSREMGDKVLRYVARWMGNYAQPLGDAARLGGDEFAVLLPGISLVHAQAVAQAMCDAVWRWQPSWAGERHWVSISIGLVMVDAMRHAPKEAMHAADMACYEAKRRGRCQVAVGQIVSPKG